MATDKNKNRINQIEYRKRKEGQGFKRLTYYIKEQYVDDLIELTKCLNELNENSNSINRQIKIVIEAAKTLKKLEEIKGVANEK